MDNIRSLWEFVRDALIADNFDDFEAEILVRFVMGMSRIDFYTKLDNAVNSSIKDLIIYYLDRRLAGEPLRFSRNSYSGFATKISS